MYTRTTLDLTTPGGVLVQHGLIVQDAPKGLVVLLPGGNYPVDAPVLYYPRMVAADLGYDALSVRYAYQVAPDRAQVQGLDAEVDAAVDAAFKRRSYDRLIVVGKSLGTPLASLLASRRKVDGLILLTPIGTSVRDAGSLPTLAVIGTNDPVYDADQIAADQGRANLRWLVIEGADHGLEVAGSWTATLDGMRRVVEVCDAFLR